MPDQERPDQVPVASWELERHGKHTQPSPLVRRLRHIQYVLLHRRGDRHLIRLIHVVHDIRQHPGTTASTPAPPLVEFTPDDIYPPDHD